MSQQRKLDELRRQMIEQNICPGLAAQATQLVMGDGNPDADIVLIGEAPGKSEDEQGIPFVGASGRFLNEMLAAAELGREDIYITNIVKYRPPNNRDPMPNEKALFWPYLIRQLEIINPKVIITLGQHSGEAFMPGLQISKDHGKAQKVHFRDHEYLVVALYHPAASLYNGSLRPVLIEDFVATVGMVRELLT